MGVVVVPGGADGVLAVAVVVLGRVDVRVGAASGDADAGVVVVSGDIGLGGLVGPGGAEVGVAGSLSAAVGRGEGGAVWWVLKTLGRVRRSTWCVVWLVVGGGGFGVSRDST